MSDRPRAPDQEARDAAVRERARNVLVDAGAGTGKTTLLVDRLVDLVAPADDGPALPLTRLAAITFTRKAAGELRLRIRERLLGELARDDLTPERRRRLGEASAALDTAHLGTIHGFADRLLRMRPVEARLSPSYQVVEDGEELFQETFSVLLHAVQAGTLAAELAGACEEALAREAERTLLDALRAGIRPESRETEWTTYHGLDALLSGFLRSRDVPPPAPALPRFQLADVRARLVEFRALAGGSHGDGVGSAWIRNTLRRIESLAGEDDPVVLFREVGAILRAEPRGRSAQKGVGFLDDPAGWSLWKAWNGDDGRGALRTGALRDDLCRPLHRWMAHRLVRTFPVVLAMYERVKIRHRALDQVDLLLRLRDLLATRPDVRADYRRLFDHVLVDEFQDTDPLQAEIVLYLCEAPPAAARWQDVRLAPGKLTLVGDPKQSIYRFRRADIAVYDAVRRIVQAGPFLPVSLTTSFRSEPALVRWLNDRFDRVLGAAAGGAPAFDPAEGRVANVHLEPGRPGSRASSVVHLPFGEEGATAEAHRALEGTALATWLRAAVGGGKLPIVDPIDRRTRPATHGDVAVLAASTWHLDLLFSELDRLGVPYSARGGTLFLEDPLHRQFLLGLRAVADRDDGVAQAALLRPPFFALDLSDLARARAAPEDSTDTGVRRARAALALVQRLRRDRASRPPGATARDLLEETAFGRAAALGPNGAQRLARLRELCLELERVAAAEGLDYDGATARLRAWIEEPIGLDPPRPVGSEAVQVLTIHQSKGLEFPVVILWDGRASWVPRAGAAPWTMDRDGERWAVDLDGLEWSEPAGADILGREQRYLAAERRRVVYVAATRARDVLVLPLAGAASEKQIAGALAAEAPAGTFEVLERYDPERLPGWAEGIEAPARRAPRIDAGLAAAVGTAWSAAVAEAARPRFAPAAVSAEAHAALLAPEGEAGERRKHRPGRHGRVFGDAVHHAIGLVLRQPGLAARDAVARAARELGLAERHAEAIEDVERALAALAGAGLRRAPGPTLQLEYPIATAREGRLHSGYVDLLSASDGLLEVVDFKTDQPPVGDVRTTHPDYVEQVRAYGRILGELGLAEGRRVRCGLLFTADGGLRWVE